MTFDELIHALIAVGACLDCIGGFFAMLFLVGNAQNINKILARFPTEVVEVKKGEQ